MDFGVFRKPACLLFAALSLAALAANAQTSARGRGLFEQKQCNQCHFFEARGTAPSVKTMKGHLKGDPARTSAAISAAAAHANEIKSVSAAEIRAIAEWLAGITFEEQAAAAAATPKPGSPEARLQAAANAKAEAAAKVKAAADAKAAARKDAEAKAKAAAEARMQARRDADAKARQDAEATAQAKREAAAKQESEALAKREAVARARKDTAALDSIKRETEEKARRDAEAQAAAKRETEALAAKREAEAKARRDADALAAQKREAEEKARHEADIKAKKDAEALTAKKPDAAAKAEPLAKTEAASKAEPAAPGTKKKLAYRDGSDLPTCPAPTGAALGSIDEERAKSIIERVGCPQCHAYVQKKTGPPMKQIHEKYKGDWECVVFRLTKNTTHKEEGVTDDLKGAEFKVVADFIATRGK